MFVWIVLGKSSNSISLQFIIAILVKSTDFFELGIILKYNGALFIIFSSSSELFISILSNKCNILFIISLLII